MSELPRYEYVKLADAIAADIGSGKLPQGAALPGERAMTELHGVSIGTVRRAIVELRKRGLVATLPAKGTYVIGMPEPLSDTPPEADRTTEKSHAVCRAASSLTSPYRLWGVSGSRPPPGTARHVALKDTNRAPRRAPRAVSTDALRA